MGRLLGAYDADELDRPDLNKCPDCGCYFATEECPLCGKLCPEEMRAGQRAAVKKTRRRSGGYTGRVQFIPWYHSWWFMLIMMFVMPLAGIVLFFTSPYSKKTKIITSVVAVVLLAVTYSGVGFWLLEHLFSEPLVDDDLSRPDYMEACMDMSIEDFHRNVYEVGAYTTMELVVVDCVTDVWESDADHAVYYICTDPTADGELTVLVRDCILEERKSYMKGDRIRVYGESAGMAVISSDGDAAIELPCLHMAYCQLIG